MTNLAVAWAFGFVVAALAELAGYLRGGVGDENLTRPVRWARGSFVRLVVAKGAAIAVFGYLFEYYVRTGFMPAARAGTVPLVAEIVSLGISVGVGVSLGKAVVRRDYRMIEPGG